MISSGKIVGIILLAFGCIACYSHKRVAPESAIADQAISIWTDSLIAARGPFASSPSSDIAKPIKVNGKYYWEGGVFALPGTDSSLLSQNGLLDVVRKSGSVIHDYYEARWPIDLKLDSLPLQIRQVRYGRTRTELNRPFWHTISPPPDNMLKELRFNNAQVIVVPDLPQGFWDAYGWRVSKNPEATSSWSTELLCDWPLELTDSLLPPEIYHLSARPNSIPTLKHSEGMIKWFDEKNDCERMYCAGRAVIESLDDTTVLQANSFNLFGFRLGPMDTTKQGSYDIRIVWPPELVIEVLPPQIQMIIQQSSWQ